MEIYLDWVDFVAVILKPQKLRCVDRDTFYKLKYEDIECTVVKTDPASDDQTDLENNYLPYCNQSAISEVKTQFERDDLILKLSCILGDVDVNQECILEILVPGTPGVDTGRFVDDGYAFTNIYTFGDRISNVEVVDVDNISGEGAGYVYEEYHDADLPEANRGWLLWCEEGNQGGIDINKIGGYGIIPSGLYLRVKFKGVVGTLATKVAVNISWGKKS